ncbi:NlpC/P60 family protein [Streptomyces puniciscabiei]
MAPESRDEAVRDEVRQRIDSLYDQAENATGNYNATRAMASVTRSRGVPLAKRPVRRPDPALDEIARQWFEGARAKLGPTVPAVLPADRMPDGPATRRSRGRMGGSPGARGLEPSARRSAALERAADRAVAELTAGRPTDPESLALAARESARAALPGPRRPELPSGGTQSTPLAGTGTAGSSAPGLALPGAAPDPRGVPADLAPVQPGGLGAASPTGLGAASATGLGTAEPTTFGTLESAGPGTVEPIGLGPLQPGGFGAAEPTGLGTVGPTGFAPVQPGGLAAAEPTPFGTPATPGFGAAEPTGLGPLQPTGLGTADPTSLGTADPTSRGAAEPTSHGTVGPTGFAPVQPGGLAAAEPTGLGPVYPAGLGAAPPAGPGPVETAVLPVATLSAAPGTPVQEPWTLPGPSAPGRPSPATSKAGNQRKLAAASDVITRYTARLTTAAAAAQAAPPPPAPTEAVAAAPQAFVTAVPPASVDATPPTPMAAAPPAFATAAPPAPTTPATAAPSTPVTAAPPAPVAAVPPPAPPQPTAFSNPAATQWQQSVEAAPGVTSAAMPAVDASSAGPAPVTGPASLAALAESSRAGRAAKAIAFARAQIGKPCVWGATGPDSYDCSSLTQAAWRAAGVPLPRAAYQQALAGAPVTLAGIEPGDLVLFFDDDRHVGLHVGGGMMVHAPGPGSSIREESIYGAGESAIHRIVRPA